MKMLALMKPEQKADLKKMLGAPFSVTSLRKPAFKAPELVDTGEWINSSPLRLEQLHGKVVVLHFYASGCINCIHNYQWYREWHDRFRNKDVVLIGIHTPETASERDIAGVRRKAAEEKLAFPILIDGQNENWNAWGNSMWPSVYLIDKRGYLRDFWAGELKWQGNDGEKYMRERIEGLLAEKNR
jgi:peroxiredoxin